MTNTSINLQELRRKIYIKAKAEKHWKFWGLYCHICKPEVQELSGQELSGRSDRNGLASFTS